MKINRLTLLKLLHHATKSLFLICILNSFSSCVNDEIIDDDFIVQGTETNTEEEIEEVSLPEVVDETTEEVSTPVINEEPTEEISTPVINEEPTEEPQITTTPTNEGAETIETPFVEEPVITTATTNEGNETIEIPVVEEVTMTEEEVDQNLIDARALLVLVNEHRGENGLPSLALSTELNKSALNHSTDMNVNNYFSHTGLDGSDFGIRVRRDTEYAGFPAGENIAVGQRSVQAVHDGWVNSPGHNRNILRDGITEMGLGHNGRYWTQIFGITR